MSESVAVIQINFKPCKHNHLTTGHSRVMKTPCMAIVHDVIKETIRTHLALVHVIHMIHRRASMGGPCTIPVYILLVWWDSIHLSDL
jgi:hypothetical protein